MKKQFLFFIIYILMTIPVHTADTQTKLSEIYKNLRCLVCQGQSVADSNSDFASIKKRKNRE